jgi:aquaporin Z
MLNIIIEAPLSGMSMNPARSLGPAVVAGDFSALWLYLVVPPLGMQLAAALHRALATTGCAKLHHSSSVRCLFCGA